MHNTPSLMWKSRSHLGDETNDCKWTWSATIEECIVIIEMEHRTWRGIQNILKIKATDKGGRSKLREQHVARPGKLEGAWLTLGEQASAQCGAAGRGQNGRLAPKWMNLDTNGLNQWAESKGRVECVRVLNRKMDPFQKDVWRASGGWICEEGQDNRRWQEAIDII